MSNYGWQIDKANTELGLTSGAMGPSDVARDNERKLREGDGDRFRMYDDDGELYYEGRIVGDYEGFEPLDEWGTPDGGASEIHYWKSETQKWERL